jgi:hypothetical protein
LIAQLESIIPEGKTRSLAVDQKNTLVLDYSYGFGLELAKILSEATQKLAKTSKSKKPGERVYRINMDDSKVI